MIFKPLKLMCQNTETLRGVLTPKHFQTENSCASF